jgi:hypothetical protein
VSHRSHDPSQDLTQGSFAFPESYPVRLDPSIRTAGQIVSEKALDADEYPHLVSVQDASISPSASIPRDENGNDPTRIEIAS